LNNIYFKELYMTIKTGDKIPACTLKTMGDKGPTEITTADIFTGKKVVLFAVPGAFTPGCSITHLPGYVVNADKIKAKGVDTIVCVSVNDAFVMGAWGEAQNAEALLMLADGNGDLTAALGLEMDGSGFGLGTRSQRFAMIVEDGKVTHLNVEDGPGVDVSSAETMMALL
jgi:peroxiredoxin